MLWFLCALAALASPAPPADPAATPSVATTSTAERPAVPDRLTAPGAVLTWAVDKGDSAGNDYEFVVTLVEVAGESGDLVYDWRMGPPKDASGQRTVPARWLDEAKLVDNQYRDGKGARFGSTSLVVSRQILAKARAGEAQEFAVAGSPPRNVVKTEPTVFELMLDDETVPLPALALTDARGGVTTVLDHDDFPAIVAVNAVQRSRLVSVQGAEPQVREALDNDGTLTSYGVRFEIGSAQLTPESERVLSAVRDWLADNTDAGLRIEGHTDAVGTEAANQALSERRATSVRDWLVAKGVPAERLAPVGLGESTPVGPNDTLAGRAANRRVVFTVVR